MLFAQAVSASESPTIDLNELKENKESIYQYAYDKTDFSEPEDLLEAYEAILGNERVREVKKENPEIIDFINE